MMPFRFAATLLVAIVLVSLHAVVAEDSALPELKPVKREVPRFPLKAVDHFQPGDAIVRVTIDADGKPRSVEMISESPKYWGFGTAATESVQQWRFQPNVPGTYKVVVKFRIAEAPRAKARDGQSLIGAVPIAPPPVERVSPVYPLLAQETRLESVIRIFAVIEDGRVTNAGVVPDGDAETIFGDPAYAAVRRWRFEKTLNGPFLIEVPFTIAGLERGEFEAKPRRSP